MNNKKSYLFGTAAALMAAATAFCVISACSGEEIEGPGRAAGSDGSDGSLPILLTATDADSASTRAGTTIQSTNFNNGQTLNAYIQNASSSAWLYDPTVYTAGTASSGKNPLTPATMPYYPANGDKVNIYGLYPTTATRPSSGTTLSFAVKDNQTSDANYMASDLMWAKVANQAQTSEKVNLQFAHKMAKLIVNASGESGTGITVSGVTLMNVNRTGTLTFATGAMASASAATNTITMSNNGAALFPPQTIGTASAAKDFVKVSTNMGDCIFTLAGKQFESGKVYTMNITLGVGNLGSTAAITGWGSDAGTVTVNPIASGGGLTIGDISAYTYNGSAKTPTPTVKLGSTTLTKDTHYTLTYSDNINAGTAWCIAIGKGTYAGSVGAKSFTINKKSVTCTLSPSTMSLSPSTTTGTLTISGYEGNGVATVTNSNTSICTLSGSGGSRTVTRGSTAGTATLTLSSIADGTNHTYTVGSAKTCSVTNTTGGSYDSPVAGDIGKFITKTGSIVTTYTSDCIGIIVYVGTDADITCGKGHGLAMALKDASDAIWGGYGTDESGGPFGTNCTDLTTARGQQKNGLTNTTYLATPTCSHTDHNAAKNAKNYTPAATGTWATSWFLPSAAQWYAALCGTGSGTYSIGGITTPLWQSYMYNDASNKDAARSAINTALGNAGDGNYTALSTSGYYWTSSERSSNGAVGVYFNSSYGVLVGYYNKSGSHHVRPFLAF